MIFLASDDQWNIKKLLLEKTKSKDLPEGVTVELVESVYRILQRHQYRINRDRPRDELVRLIDKIDWGD